MDKKKLKVAFFSFYSGEVYRGVETYVHELSNRLVDLGVSVTVFQNGTRLLGSRYETVSAHYKILWDKEGVVERRWRVPLINYYEKLVGKFTRKVLQEIDKDTDIIVTTNGSLQVFYARVWCLVHGKKLIAVGQSGPGADDKWNLLCFPSVFIALTNFHRAWAKKFNPLVRVEKIPNGVDLKRFRVGGKKIEMQLPYPIVLSVGALEVGKRLDLLIRAVAKTKFSLVLVGKGKLESELLKMGNELLGDRFKIMSVPFEKMARVYPAAHLFSYPTSPWESFGIVMVEAMASGLAVVATDDPIRREIVGDAGYFVDPTNTDKYAEALKKAMDTKWGDRPRKQAEKFNWDDIAIAYKKLFEEIC